MNKQLLSALETYARAAIVAVGTLLSTNPNISWSDLGKGLLVALSAPALRAINPSDSAYGIKKK